jgi:mxaJ protein
MRKRVLSAGCWVLSGLLLLGQGCAKTQRSALSTQHSRVLRVCADPNNLPYSNARQEGFENKIASLVARDLNARVDYTWFPQRRGFVRNTLRAGLCDCVIGVPANYELTLGTQPYYRSSYVFVARRDRRLGVTSLDDPRLRTWKVGVQMIGNDHVNSPPAHALANRGAIRNVVGYMVYDPQAIVDAVARGDVDVAVVWGPQAGYFARQERVPLDITPVSPQVDLPFLPFVFDISIGVRRGDNALRDELDKVLDRRRADIEKILDRYGVPRV